MDFIYGLAVVLIIFEGIIIQCEGGGGSGGASSSNQEQFGETIATKEAQIHLSSWEIAEIVRNYESRTGLEYELEMSNILQHHIVIVWPNSNITTVRESYIKGDLFLEFGEMQMLKSLFKDFGNKVKNIYCEYRHSSSSRRNEFNDKIIKKYAPTLEELVIHCPSGTDYCEKILNENYFPKVKKFQFLGSKQQFKFELISKFPSLKSFVMARNIHNFDCLEHKKGLNELALNAAEIEEKQLQRIFINNGDIQKICLYYPARLDTMKSIANYLKHLQKLEISGPNKDFLFGENQIKLKYVTHFYIDQWPQDEEFGNLKHSFKMPRLNKLTLCASQFGMGIVNFINNFNLLNEVELFVKYYDLKCIVQLKHIKECTTYIEGNGFNDVEKLLKNFDEKSKLEVLKFVNNDEHVGLDPFYETMKKFIENPLETMRDINKNLRRKWTYEEETKTRQKYSIFRRRGPANRP